MILAFGVCALATRDIEGVVRGGIVGAIIYVVPTLILEIRRKRGGP
jgi:hypothetical protein